MVNLDDEGRNQRSGRDKPIATIWLFRDRLRVKANPTITYRSLLVLVAAVIAFIVRTNLTQVLEQMRQILSLLGQ